jgi:hypothetical protein
MAGENKPNEKRPRPDTDVSRRQGPKDKQQSNNSDSKTGEINRGNTQNIGYSQQPNELHSKKNVTGSDSDGQAE